MSIIIAGAGKAGLLLTRKLLSEGYQIVVVDNDPQVLDTCSNRYDIMCVRGNCASMEVLEMAGVREANILVAMAGEDEHNMLCCITAHAMNPEIHTIARLRNPEYGKQVYSMRNVYALSMTVNPDRQVALEVERMLKFPGFLRRDTFAKGRAEMVELKVKEDGNLCNVALSNLYSLIKSKVLVCGVRRDGVVYTPDGNFVLEEGDRIYVTGTTPDLSKMLRNLGIITHKVHRVMICGGGITGFFLAQRLCDSGINVYIVDRDPKHCEELAERLPKATIICGDASSQDFLEAEGMDRCDAVVAMTGMDEINVIISLYAQTMGIDNVVTKMDHIGSTRIHDALGLGTVVCPQELCCNEIVTYIHALKNKTGAALSVHTFADDQLEALEYRVTTDTPHRGVALKDISLRKGILIAAISHGRLVEIPNGDSAFDVGDGLVVVASGDIALQRLDDIFI